MNRSAANSLVSIPIVLVAVGLLAFVLLSCSNKGSSAAETYDGSVPLAGYWESDKDSAFDFSADGRVLYKMIGGHARNASLSGTYRLEDGVLVIEWTKRNNVALTSPMNHSYDILALTEDRLEVSTKDSTLSFTRK